MAQTQTQSDPWAEAAKNYKAPVASPTAPASGGNDDWKIWQDQSSAEQEQPGFLENLGKTLGIEKNPAPDPHPVRTGLEMLMGGPVLQAAKGLGSGFMRTTGELGQSVDAMRAGNPADAGVHAITALPFVGPALNRMADEAPATKPGQSWTSKVWADATPGNIGTGLGTAAQLAPLLLGGADDAAPGRPLLGEIPTRGKAGRIFTSVMNDAADQPVKFTRSMEPMERAQQLSARGGGTVGAVDNLFKRVNTVNPLDYREARDWASNLSRLTGTDEMNASPAMKTQVRKLSRAFNGDVGDAAAEVGRGEDYAKAMKMYARASRNAEIARNVGRWGAGLGATAAGIQGARAFVNAIKK